MEVHTGQEQPPELEALPGQQHGAPGAELLAVGGHEIAHTAEGQEQQVALNTATALGEVAAAAGKHTLGACCTRAQPCLLPFCARRSLPACRPPQRHR